MTEDSVTPARVRWARLRFSVVGPLLGSPPEPGELAATLAATLAALASMRWRHPTTDEVIRFSAKSIERWFYTARGAHDPIVALERKVPKHAGTHPSITPTIAEGPPRAAQRPSSVELPARARQPRRDGA